MHKTLVKEASESQLRDFVTDALSMLKGTHPSIYEDLELWLYKEVHGCHFSESLLHQATSRFVNEDGSSGPHWNLEQSNSLAKSYGIEFKDFNEYDWNYVLNMIYSDYYGTVPNDSREYVKLAKKFIEDKDAPKGKALKYYMAMK